MLKELQDALKDFPMVAAVRGRGFVFGVEYAQPETLEMFPASYWVSWRKSTDSISLPTNKGWL